MKRRLTALLTVLILALSLCVPAMAEADYGLVYDETEMLYSEDLSDLGEYTLPALAEELGIELRVDVLTGNSYESINAAAEGIYERFGYGCGDACEGATLTILMEPQDDGSYAMPERGGWCVYVKLSPDRGSEQALTDALYAAVEPYMNDPSAWDGSDMDAASMSLAWAVNDMAEAAIDYICDSELLNEPDDGEDIGWDDGQAANNAYTPYVYDIPELLSFEEWEELETKAEMISLSHDCNVYLLFLDDYYEYSDYTDVYDAAADIYHSMNFGAGENRDGIMVLLSMDERDYAMFVYGKNAKRAFNKYGQEQLESEFLGYFTENDWYNGAVRYLDVCDEYLTLAEEGHPVRRNMVGIYAIVAAASCVLSLGICVILKMSMKTVYKKAEANEYVAANGLHLTQEYDRYTHTTETRTKISSDSDSGSTSSCSGGGGSGRSGKF